MSQMKPLRAKEMGHDSYDAGHVTSGTFSCIVKTQKQWSIQIYKTELTKIRYRNQVLSKYRVNPQRAELTLIPELTWLNIGLKGILRK